MRSATTSLRGHPSSVAEARRWTRTTLTAWGLETTAWTAAQVVSELATNCALHARTAFSLRLSVEGGGVRIEAADGVAGGLQPRLYSSTSTTGRGLRIVAGLSTSWGVLPTGEGKTVWAVLPLEDPLPAHDDDGGDDDGGEPSVPRTTVPTDDAAPAGPLLQAAA